MKAAIAGLTAALALFAAERGADRGSATRPILAAVVSDILEGQAKPGVGVVACVDVSFTHRAGDKRSADPTLGFLREAVPAGYEAVPLSQCRGEFFGYSILPASNRRVPVLHIAQPRWFGLDFAKVEAFYLNQWASYALTRDGDVWHVDSSRVMAIQ